MEYQERLALTAVVEGAGGCGFTKRRLEISRKIGCRENVWDEDKVIQTLSDFRRKYNIAHLC